MTLSRAIVEQLVGEARAKIGATPLTKAADALHKALVAGGFSYSIVGGYAVQHYGYVRGTQDLDAIVNDRDNVRHYLAATGQFKAAPGQQTVIHKATGVRVDLLPAGRRNSPDSIPYPQPAASFHKDSNHLTIHFIDLPGLVTLKLDAGRPQDEADVVGLIQSNQLTDKFVTYLPEKYREDFLQCLHKANKSLESRQVDPLEAGGLYYGPGTVSEQAQQMLDSEGYVFKQPRDLGAF